MKNLHERWPTGDDLCAEIARETDTVALAFSAGKDSVGAWLMMRRHFKRIVPIYKCLVPGLQFVEDALRYYEDWFGTKIIRAPHPSLYRMLSNCLYQPPERVGILEAAELEEFSHEELRDWCMDDLGLPRGTWIAVGTRACDSPQRRMAFWKHGPQNRKLGTFYPVYDWNKATLYEAIKAAGVKLPPEYRVFGRSWDGIDFRFLYGIRKHWPEDYAKIVEWFPLCELEFVRYEMHLKRGGK